MSSLVNMRTKAREMFPGDVDRRSFLLLSGSAVLVGLGVPASAGRISELRSVADILRAGIADRMVHGCVCCRGDGSALTFDGLMRFSPETRPMCAAARFDLASVTKAFVAVTAAELAAAGLLDVDAPFTDYLPDHVLAKEGCRITVRDLATHSGGFANDKPYQTPDVAAFRRALWNKRPQWGRGERFCYACSNFIYLGLIVEKVTGEPLHVAVNRAVIGPLGLTQTSWGPIGGDPMAVQMEPGDVCMVPGVICDETARALPFPVGNAGMFSTATDLAKFVDALAKGKVFSQKALDLVRTPTFETPDARRSFGFDMSPAQRPAGLSARTIFHSGFSGQTICADPETGFSAVVLSNRYGNRYEPGKIWRNRVISELFAAGSDRNRT